MNYYLDVLKQYAVFAGRATRKQYWMFFLINLLVAIGVGIVAGIIHLSWLSSLYTLALIVPSIAVAVRRLHDTNRSGWWVLIALIPVVGWVVIIVFLAQKGGQGDNQYGPKPLELKAA